MARFVLLWTLVLLGFWPHPAFAEKRVALVIGNGAYQNVAPLPNPARDAKAIVNFSGRLVLKLSGADRRRELGFQARAAEL